MRYFSKLRFLPTKVLTFHFAVLFSLITTLLFLLSSFSKNNNIAHLGKHPLKLNNNPRLNYSDAGEVNGSAGVKYELSGVAIDSANLDQLRNGAVERNSELSGINRLNGNAGIENSHFLEGCSMMSLLRFLMLITITSLVLLCFCGYKCY